MVRGWMEEFFTFFKTGKYSVDVSCSLGSELHCVCHDGLIILFTTEKVANLYSLIAPNWGIHIYIISHNWRLPHPYLLLFFCFFLRDICQIRQYLLQSSRTSTPNLCETSSCTCGSCWAAGNKPMADPRSQILFSSPVPGIFTPCCELDCSSMGGRGTAGSVCEICVFRWIVKNNTQTQNSSSLAAAMLHVCLHLMPLNLIIFDWHI